VNRTLSTKYAICSAGLLAVLIVALLSAAGVIGFSLTQSLHNQLKDAYTQAQVINQKEALLESGHYLGNRLFNPLFNLDISGINDEIRQISRWLPTRSILILDKNSRVLTDGSDANSHYGESIKLPAALSPNSPTLLKTEGGHELFLTIGYAGEIAGYAKVDISNTLFHTSIIRLEKELDSLWDNFATTLIFLAIAGIGLTMGLAFYLSWRLSHSLSRPLADMTLAADKFAAGNLEHQLTVHTSDEIGDLGRALNKMAGDLKKTGQLLSKAQEMAGLGSWEWNLETEELILSSGAFRVMGINLESFEPTVDNLLALLPLGERNRIARALNLSIKKPVSVEFTFFRNNEERIVHLQGEPTVEKMGCLGTIQDVTEQRHTERRMTYLANYDTLTDLPNRNLFQERLAHAITHAKRKGSNVALLFIDLDRFKAINDSLGHPIGDKLLNSVAIRLLKVLRESDTVARLGGDEFTIILEDLENTQYPASVAQKLLDKLSRSFLIEGRELFITASIGITIFPRDATNINTLCKNADTAMYLAKDEGKDTYRFFTPELNLQAHKRMALENNLRRAMEKREFEIYYQPQLDLSTGHIVAMEALLRWHNKGDWIRPDEFIPVLEETGMLTELTGWILKESCTRTSQWQNAGFKDLTIAVNLSPKQLQQKDLIDLLQKALKMTGLSAEHLELEITENSLVNQQEADSNLSRIKELGIKLAVDDFGTGYSSLSYLKLFNVDTLKIDRSFIRDILTDNNDALIVSAVVALSARLGITPVAEGVETLEQAALIKTLGCDIVQGYLFSKPLPSEQLLEWAKTRQVSDLSPKTIAFRSAQHQ
jgi:diguanylate cyclase (GGDEF)-like protein